MITEDAIRAGLESYLAPVLAEYDQRIVEHRQAKVMRDVIWGFNSYEPYELAIIDSPPFQRLRYISQTSLASFTYPCAVHTRYEHSIGAAAVALRMLDAIERRGPPSLLRDPTLKIETRLGVLLHDLGHGPFSHSSEKFFENLADAKGDPIFKGPTGLGEQNPIFAEASAGEILTYLMITTASFKRFWSKIVSLYGSQESQLRSVDLERVGRMILGTDVGIGGDARYYRQIVNGPFDADKLDYLPRDGYFTGLETAVDIERLLTTITVVTRDGTSDLGVVVAGSSVLEQIIFFKTQLYASMYHHHKVRAAHRLFQHLLKTMYDRDYKPAGWDLRDPVSYVALDDHDMLRANHGDEDIDSIVRQIKARNLPKRALVIAHPCFDSDDQKSRENFVKLEDVDLARIESEIENRARLRPGSVFFDVPEPPRFGSTAQAVVELADGRTVLLEELYPAGAWANAWAGYRRVAYIFTTADDRRKVANEARRVLADLDYPILLNDYSFALAKLG